MRLGRIKSPDETTEPTFSENISLVVCPFLGLEEDPGTSLGFSHAANHCHRLEKPVGIDLAHQNRFCLCDNYTQCYVYGQSRSQSKPVRRNKADPSLPSPALDDPELGLNEQSAKKRGLRVIGLLVMLLLIVLAAIIWWPPPGTSLQDAIAQGASITKDITGFEGAYSEIDPSSKIEQTPLETDDTLVGNSTALKVNSAESEPADQNAHAGGEKSDEALDVQEKTADASLSSSEKDAPAPGESIAAGEDGFEENPELSDPAADYETVVPETAVVGEGDTVEEEQTGAEDEESAEQASKRQIAAPEEAEQVDAEEINEQEADDVSASETDTPDSAPVDSGASGSPSAVTTTHIGPLTSAAGLQGTSDSSSLLFLHRHPGDGAEMLAMIPERQTATVLGRNSSGEWLLVRLASGIEGWVHARESGASVIISNLPVMDDVSGDVSVAQGPAPTAAPAEEVQDSTPESGSSSIVGTAIVNSGALNLRLGPGLEYEKIGVAYNGQQISLLEQLGSNVWVQVRLADGSQGWMNSKYLIQTTWVEG